MTDLRKAAEMALEALNSKYIVNCGAWMLQQDQAAEALRQALAQTEQEFVGACVTCGAPKGEWLVDTVNTSQERVDERAKREQEPVAWIMEMPPPSGADRSVRMTSCKEVTQDWENAIPLYTAPPQREWVGLTVNEAREFYEKYTNRAELIYVIDKFLEEKNHG